MVALTPSAFAGSKRCTITGKTLATSSRVAIVPTLLICVIKRRIVYNQTGRMPIRSGVMKKTGIACVILALLVVFPILSLAQNSSDTPGQIAYIGTDNNVYTIAPGGAAPTALTSDASVTATAASIYQWPTWSPDGQLAYFRSSVDSTGGASTEVMIAPDGQTPGVSAFVAQEQSFTYANWSPKACGTDCHDLTVLFSGASSLSVDWLRWQNGTATHTTVGTGAPFYYSW